MTKAERFVAVTPTYPRANGSTPAHLRTTAFRLEEQSVRLQLSWILVGDNYPSIEFIPLTQELKSIFSGEIHIRNTNRAVRDIQNLHPKNRWAAGGMDARMLAWQIASDDEYDFSLWLDDDELWHSDHVSSAVEALHDYPEAELSFSAANYGSIVLPREFGHKDHREIKPMPGNTVSSTLCLRKGRPLKLMLEVWREHLASVYSHPAVRLPNEDATFLRACHANGVRSIFVPRVTVTKLTQQGEWLP